jgi:hypothetical protein
MTPPITVTGSASSNVRSSGARYSTQAMMLATMGPHIRITDAVTGCEKAMP